MMRKNPILLVIFLFSLLFLMGGAAVLKDGLFIEKHEADTLHLMAIVFRMAEGQTPHLDFMTPIGAWAFWPIAALVKLGFGIGMAVIWSQVLMASIFLPIVVWTAWTRLTLWVGALFGLFVMVLLLALVHGEAQSAVSISMHYNRLAWSAAFVAIVTALIPPQRWNNPTIDGAIVGLMVCLMAMIKMTYFISFAVPILLALILTKQNRALVMAMVTGAGVVAIISAFNGMGYWEAYAGDLLTVAKSETRSAPGEPLSAVVGAPAYLAGSIAVIVAAVFLRQTGVKVGGLILLLLVPGFFYVTYQNYGNDPQWLMLLGVLILALRGQGEEVVNDWGWNLRDNLRITAVIALVLSSPSFFNMASSPFRHLNLEISDYVPILPRAGVHTDVQMASTRVNRVSARFAMNGQVDPIPELENSVSAPVLMGETLPTNCSVELGLVLVMDTMVRDIEDAGLADGKSVFVADILSIHWLFGDLEPVDNGAPWNYGGVPGLQDADYVLVPLCPFVQTLQAQIVNVLNESIDDGMLKLNEVRRTELYILYEKIDLS